MKIGSKIQLKSSGVKGVVIEGNNLNDGVPANLVYVKLETGKKFYYDPKVLKSAKSKAAPKKEEATKKEKEPVAKKATPKKEKKS